MGHHGGQSPYYVRKEWRMTTNYHFDLHWDQTPPEWGCNFEHVDLTFVEIAYWESKVIVKM